MLESKDLELQSRLTIGTLESNAEAIRKVVLKHLEDYTPENYIGRAVEAKADKALLNKAEKGLNLSASTWSRSTSSRSQSQKPARL